MIEINNTTKKKINQAAAKRLASVFLSTHGQSGKDLSIAIVGPARMRTLNRRYRGLDRPTDVLSFSGSGKDLGEIIINYEEVEKAGKYLEVFGALKTPRYIFLFLLVHGLLHLVGYNDERETDRLEMLRLGEEFLASQGFSGFSGTL